MTDKISDARLAAIIDKQLELAESGDRKAAEFVLKMCGAGASPSTLVQNNYYYTPGQKKRKGRPKTPLGIRIKNYLTKHGATKPAILAVELEAETDEIEQELEQSRDQFRPTPAGWEVF